MDHVSDRKPRPIFNRKKPQSPVPSTPTQPSPNSPNPAPPAAVPTFESVSRATGEMKLHLNEEIDMEVLNALLRLPKGKLDPIDRKRLGLMKDNIKYARKLNVNPVVYEVAKSINSDLHNFGRLTAQMGSLQSLSSTVRQALASRNSWDLDMESSQLRIVRELFRRCGLSDVQLAPIDFYLQNRKTLFAKGDDHCINVAKEDVLSLMFDHGSHRAEKWAVFELQLDEARKRGVPGLPEPGFFLQFSETFVSNAHLLINQDGWREKLRSYYEASQDKSKNKYPSNQSGSMLAIMLQTIETNILQCVRLALKDHGFDMNVLIHDGGLVMKKEGLNCIPAEVISSVEDNILNTLGFPIKLAVKEMLPPEEILRKSLDIDLSESEQVQAALVYFVEEMSESMITDLTALNGGKPLVFKSDLEAGSFLAYHFLQKGWMLLDRTSATSGVNLCLANTKVSNLVSSSEAFVESVISKLGVIINPAGDSTGRPMTVSQLGNVRKAMAIYAAGIPDASDVINRLNDDTMYKVFYRNGYWHLREKVFVPRTEDSSAVTMVRVEADFPSQEKWDALSMDHPDVKAVYEHIVGPFGLTDQEKRGFLRILARAIGGCYRDKMSRYTLVVGERNSGKGTEAACRVAAFGRYPNGYVTFGNPPMCTDKQKDDTALINKDLLCAGTHIARMQICNELVSGGRNEAMLDGERLKSIEGADPITGRVLHKNDEQRTPIQFTTLYANQVPSFKGDPSCMANVAYWQMPYKFYEAEDYEKVKASKRAKLAIPDIKEKAESPEWALAYTWLIFNAFEDKAFNPRGSEVSARNKVAKETAFAEVSNSTVGVFTTCDLIAVRTLEFLTPEIAASPDYDPKEWFASRKRLAEIWRRAYTEPNSVENIGGIVNDVMKKSERDIKPDQAYSRKITKYFMSCDGLETEDAKIRDLDGRRMQAYIYRGVRISKSLKSPDGYKPPSEYNDEDD